MRERRFIVQIVHHVVEPESIYPVVKITIAIGVHPIFKKLVVVFEYSGTV